MNVRAGVGGGQAGNMKFVTVRDSTRPSDPSDPRMDHMPKCSKMTLIVQNHKIVKLTKINLTRPKSSKMINSSIDLQ